MNPFDNTNNLLLIAVQSFLDRKYTAVADSRQRELGLAYMEAERQDLAYEVTGFILSLASKQAAQPAPLADAALAELEAATAAENDAYKSGSIAWPEYYKEACQLAYNAHPGLLARLRAAEAKAAPTAELVVIREWHDDCERSVRERGDSQYIQAANYGREYMAAVNLLLNMVSPPDGNCTTCGATRRVLPGQVWGSCTNNDCVAYKEDKASASYLDAAPTVKGGQQDA